MVISTSSSFILFRLINDFANYGFNFQYNKSLHLGLTLNKIHINTKTVLACTSVVVASVLIIEPLAMFKEAFTVNLLTQNNLQIQRLQNTANL